MQAASAKVCSVEGCGKKHEARGFCVGHYSNWRYNNNPRHRETAIRCAREYYSENREKRLEQSKKSGREYYARKMMDPEERARRREKNRLYNLTNDRRRARLNAAEALRRATKLKQTPAWADLEKIQEVYDLARELSWLSEGGLEVDHVVPLRGKQVRGLHVHYNLEIIPAPWNARKNNKFGNS
jgi:hypothetical protein